MKNKSNHKTIMCVCVCGHGKINRKNNFPKINLQLKTIFDINIFLKTLKTYVNINIKPSFGQP